MRIQQNIFFKKINVFGVTLILTVWKNWENLITDSTITFYFQFPFNSILERMISKKHLKHPLADGRAHGAPSPAFRTGDGASWARWPGNGCCTCLKCMHLKKLNYLIISSTFLTSYSMLTHVNMARLLQTWPQLSQYISCCITLQKLVLPT